jgi:hypothetical protein
MAFKASKAIENHKAETVEANQAGEIPDESSRKPEALVGFLV